MGDKNDKNNNFIDFTSHPTTSPDLYLAQLPPTKCGSGEVGNGINFYIEPNMYHGFRISNSEGEAVFSGEGEHKFKLGDTEYLCTVYTKDYNTETPYGRIQPHNNLTNYFEVVVKQLSDDPTPDMYTTTTTTHKAGTTVTVPTTTKKVTSTTTPKHTTTTTKKVTTTTTTTTTTTKPVTTTSAQKETPNLIPPTGKELEYNGTLQELVNAGKASGGTVQYKIGENGTWSEKIPTASEIGNYTVYYRIVGNEKYFGSDENSDLKGRKNYAFPYCYDCQRRPAHPSKGDQVRAYDLRTPLVGDMIFDTKNKSNWTLEYVSPYKDFKGGTDYLPGLVKSTQEAHSLATSDDISIYELKDNGKHVTYCVIIAVSTDEKAVLFFGDTIKGGGGYILSADELGNEKYFTVDKDIKDINVETIALSGSVNSKIFESSSVKYGDTNCDGNVDLADAILIMQSLANPDKYVVSPQGKTNGDVDWSVKGLTANDALTIQEFLLHKIKTLDPRINN